MRKLFPFLMIFGLLVLTACDSSDNDSSSSDADVFVGTWALSGFSSGGQDITAVVGQQGSAVQINWTVGNQSYSGSGIRDGQVVVINWGQTDPVVYVVMTNGELHGTWNRGTALERLLPQ